MYNLVPRAFPSKNGDEVGKCKVKARENKHVMSFLLFYFHVRAFSISWTPLSQSLEQAKMGSGFNLKTVISAKSKYNKRKKLLMSPNFLLPL